ncbi:hypothetical protein [Algihabitans sp.]|uniref:hypothetical protein n=1 Tax=Algihabitans sp. TaxID=2821514 RepID=UPI003BADA518
MEKVIKCPVSNRVIELDVDADSWFVTIEGACYLIGDESDNAVLAVLPFLEIPIQDFKKSVSEFLIKYPGSIFPYEVFIHAGFKHGSPHWTDCALEWLSGLNHKPESDFSKELEIIVQKKKRYSQKSRHLAWKLLKRGY